MNKLVCDTWLETLDTLSVLVLQREVEILMFLSAIVMMKNRRASE